MFGQLYIVVTKHFIGATMRNVNTRIRIVGTKIKISGVTINIAHCQNSLKQFGLIDLTFSSRSEEGPD